MSAQMTKRDEFIKPLKNLQQVNGKQFDNVINILQDYAAEYGLSEKDLNIVTDVCLTPEIAKFRLRKLMKSLIPRTCVPEISIRNAIKWLLAQLRKDRKPLLNIKYVLEWLSGILQFELEKTEVINEYYDLFYYYMDKEYCNVTACKIIYLLTKPSDVNRWYVKQVLCIHEKYFKPKYTSALLFLFKMYRPDCVPENIQAYVVHNVFGLLPENLIKGFTKARDNIIQNNATINNENTVIWIQFEIRKHKKRCIRLIPSIAENEINLNTNMAGSKPLLSLSKVSDLHKYHLSSSSPGRVMALINNSAGFHLLIFCDTNIHSKLSYQLYYTLRDAFLETNQFVSKEEKIKLLNQLSFLQIHIQQSIPVVSKFLAEYLIRWDGSEYEQQIYRLMRWLNIISFVELKDCILTFLFSIFTTSTIETKCKILGFLGDIVCNMIITYTNRMRNNRGGLFLKIKDEWTLNDITDLYKYIKIVCNLGLYLENGHSLIMDNIIHLYYKIFKVELMCDKKIFQISIVFMYYALFSSNPNNLIRICDLMVRYPKYFSKCLKQNFFNTLWSKQSLAVYSPNKKLIKKLQLIFIGLNMNESCDWTRHFALACYNYKILGKINPAKDFDDFLDHARSKYFNVCLFLENYTNAVY